MTRPDWLDLHPEDKADDHLPVMRPMARRSDPSPSHESAGVVRPSLGKIQRLVLEAFRARGQMTARTCERLECFNAYGFSTIRKRISELAADGHLVESGVDRSGRAPATIYAAGGGDGMAPS